MNEGHEHDIEFIETREDTTESFEPPEQSFHLISFAVHGPVVFPRVQTVCLYDYNAANALTGYTDSNTGHADHLAHGASYTLDALQRRIQESITLGGQTVTLATGYQATGRKASQTWPDGSTVSYRHDDGQLLKDIQFPAVGTNPAGTLTISQRSWNAPTAILYPGGSTRSHSLDGFQRMTELRVKDPGQTEVMRYRYAFDAENNILQKDTEHGFYDYQYDSLYRLTAADNPESLPNEAYGYDKLGNRLTDRRRPNPAQAGDQWQYNANNQLTESATENTALLLSNSQPITHGYDANGSLIRKSTPAGSEANHPYDNQRFVYDAQNRLTEVQDPAGNPIASYQYDPYGRRIRKTIHRAWNGGAWESLAEARAATYFYSEEGLIAEYQAQGNNAPQLTVQYGWQPEGAWSTDPVWIKATPAGGSEATYFYYQNDHLGTPQKIIDGQGQSVWGQKATAFGEMTVDAAATISNNLRFPGQYFDQETGMQYNFFRDYDPTVGRYVESDPIGLEGGINTYLYAKANPVEFIDPLGLVVQGSWIQSPRFNIKNVGVDNWDFVSPSFSIWGYLQFIRLYGHASGYINIDVKCTDDCKEWEVHNRILVDAQGSFDVGPNLYALGAGFAAGPYVGISVNIAIAGAAALQAEHHFLSLAQQKAGPIIAATLANGPTLICLGGNR